MDRQQDLDVVFLIDVTQLDGVIRKRHHLSHDDLLGTFQPQGAVVTLIVAFPTRFAFLIDSLEGTSTHHPVVAAITIEHKGADADLLRTDLRIPFDDEVPTMISPNRRPSSSPAPQADIKIRAATRAALYIILLNITYLNQILCYLDGIQGSTLTDLVA